MGVRLAPSAGRSSVPQAARGSRAAAARRARRLGAVRSDAVAVFTRTARTSALLPAADAVIGTAARLAVDAQRAP
ncbi:hypothetical protein [Streptomyces sp. NPDC016172]|uniref:hypothetical protein n=1 Tax=Streptomyces sp. NPDC016172 TaxID=3364964 RepID=UPI0036F9D0C7